MNSQPPEPIQEIIIESQGESIEHNSEELEIEIEPEDVLFGTEEYLELSELPDDAIGVTKCEDCNRFFDSKRGITSHLKYCNGPDPNAKFLNLNNCEICSASFKYPGLLEAHMNVHNGIKPFKCRVQCDMHFYSVPLRIAHEKKCHGEQQICQFCNARLSNPLMLARHLKSAHKGAKYECKICGKVLASNKTLKVHQRMMHSNEPPKSKCEVCGKGFKESWMLERHKGELCQAGMSSAVSQKKYMRFTHGKTMLSCQTCGGEFPNSTALDIHRLIVHKENREIQEGETSADC